METLIQFLFSSEKLPGGTHAYSIGYEGISWTTAGWIFSALVLLVGLSYARFARKTSRITRIGLVALRLLLIAVLLLLLVRPVLIIPQEETTRRPLLVLLDTSRSMTIADRRDTDDDRARAALASGLIDPTGGLHQSLPASPDNTTPPTRAELLTALAGNPRLSLWPRLQASADLSFYGFGRQLADLGPFAPSADGSPLTLAQSSAFFRSVSYQEERTAVGDGLRDLLAKTRGQSLAGVLVISDGANNEGGSLVEAARAAQDDDVPLFVYGVGVSAPPDIVLTELSAPPMTTVKERVDIGVRFSVQGLNGYQSTLRLKAGDQLVAEERVDFRTAGEQEWKFSYVPEKTGELELNASITPLAKEAVKTNNARSASLRVMDQKIDVLLVQREPNWDFQYLLAMLQRDRRVSVKCVLLKGDPGLYALPDSPFLRTFPSDRAGLLGHDVIILGDVAPADLGDARMKLLHEWVNQLGGGLVFLSGSNLNANAYRGTPLEPILPVTPGGTVASTGTAELPLTLTPAGAASPLLRLSDNLRTNVDTWNAFPGVRWITPAGPARPSAQVLLVGPVSGRPGDTPPTALALQSYGAGQSLYIGMGETHRWRANAGEKYHTRLWLQMLQAISARREPGASSRSQLKVERAEYFTGERVRLTARMLKADFTPLDATEIIANLKPQTTGVASASPVEVRLAAVAGRPGEFSGDTPAPVEGLYSVSLAADPGAAVPFRVKSSDVELGDIALRERTLRAMAVAGGGKFLREEDLHQLPGWIASETAKRVTYKKVPLTLAPSLLVLMLLAACIEWFWRRKAELK